MSIDGCWFVGVASALLQSIWFDSISLYVDSMGVGGIVGVASL
jgi:hypothetical protein